MAILWALLVVVVATKVSEDVLDGESGPIDTAVLGFIGMHTPAGLTSAFDAISVTGSAHVLVPLTAVATVALLIARRRFEAGLLAVSTISGASVVYIVKTVVGRARPDLWPAQWYWGSSFPSGHTLVVAAFATASALSLARIWPATREWAVGLAIVCGSCSWPSRASRSACTGPPTCWPRLALARPCLWG